MVPTMRLRALCLILLTAVLLVGCGASTTGFSAVQLFPFAQQPPGKLLVVKDGSLWLWKDGQARQLTSGNTWQQPAWSPDGSEIAYIYRSYNWSDVFVMSGDGSNARRLTSSQSSRLDDNDWNFRPTWSPDGSRLAYISDARTPFFAVYTMDREGKGQTMLRAPLLLSESADAMSWSADGKMLAVATFNNETSHIVLVDLARGTASVAIETPRGVIDPALSPDGSAIAYAQREGNRVEVRVRVWGQEGEIQVTKNGLARAPAWSPDGRWLAYLSAHNGTFELYAVEVDLAKRSVSGERQLTRDLNLDGTSGISWAR